MKKRTAAVAALGIALALGGCGSSGFGGKDDPTALDASAVAAAVDDAAYSTESPLPVESPAAAAAAAPAAAAETASADPAYPDPAPAETSKPAKTSKPARTVKAAAAEAAAPAAPAAPAAESSPAALPEGRIATQIIAKDVPKMGSVVTDEKGWILYRFDKDKADPPTSNCTGKCAQIWPPVIVEGSPIVKGVSTEVIGTVLREDSSRQVTVNGWPVYYYIGDKKPGTWKGQGVGGTWFVVDKNGKKNLTCVPKGTPKAVPLPDTASQSSADGY